MPELDCSRGTVVWGFNWFRTDALTQFLNDLLELENRGMEEEHCDLVQGAIGRIVNVATAIPDGSWLRRSVWSELQVFEQLYIEWNHHAGPDSHHHRRHTLRHMRRRRNRIATRVRKNQFILSNELDLKLVEDMHGALGNLTTSLPELFKNLAAAVGRFASRS
jgi:hypothetical protein